MDDTRDDEMMMMMMMIIIIIIIMITRTQQQMWSLSLAVNAECNTTNPSGFFHPVNVHIKHC